LRNSRTSQKDVFGASVLEELDRLLEEMEASEEEVARLDSLTVKGVAGGFGNSQAGADQLRKKAKRRSRDLDDKIAAITDKALEKAFKQFDTDDSMTIDRQELQAAYTASGMPISEKNLQRAMKLLDKNGDGVLDMREFKEIALMTRKLSTMDKKYSVKVENALMYAGWLTELRKRAAEGVIDLDWTPQWNRQDSATGAPVW